MQPDERTNRLLVEVEHGLKTPLLAAIRKAQMSLEREHPTREDVMIIHALCTKMYGQLATFQTFARLASGEEVKVNKVPLSAQEIIKILRSAIQDTDVLMSPDHRGRFELVIEELLNAKVDVDLNLFDVILRNLLDNAIKYSYADSSILVTAKTTDQLELSITSKGLSILPNDLQYIFERGWRSSSAISATAEGGGIGLWIVREAVKVLNGRISIEPQGNVTTAKLQLPCSYENPDC